MLGECLDPLQQYRSPISFIGGPHKQATLQIPVLLRIFYNSTIQLLSALQGLKMTDGLYSMTVCNASMVEAQGSYPYRSYELLAVRVRHYSLCKLRSLLYMYFQPQPFAPASF